MPERVDCGELLPVEARAVDHRADHVLAAHNRVQRTAVAGHGRSRAARTAECTSSHDRTHASVRCQCARARVCVCVFVSWRVCACVRARTRVLLCASVRLSACVRACARASLPFRARMGSPQRARVGDRHRIGSCSFSTMASSLKAISLPVLSLQPPPAHGRSCAEPAMAMVRDSPAAARTQRPPAAQRQQLCATSSSPRLCRLQRRGMDG